MPVLPTVERERFASAVAEGLSGVEAYKKAGYNGLNAKRNAENLLSDPAIKARIKELTAQISKQAANRAAKRLSLTKELILAELWDNAQQGRKVKGGSAVRNRALELIGKHLGMFQDEAGKPLNVEDLTAEQIRKLLGDDAPPPPAVLQ